MKKQPRTTWVGNGKGGKKGRAGRGQRAEALVLPAALQWTTVGQRGRVGSRAAESHLLQEGSRKGLCRTRKGIWLPSGLFSGCAAQSVSHSRWIHLLFRQVKCVCSVASGICNLCDPMDCSPSGSSVRGILQARILEWVATPSPRGSSWPRDRTHISFVSCMQTREAPKSQRLFTCGHLRVGSDFSCAPLSFLQTLPLSPGCVPQRKPSREFLFHF